MLRSTSWERFECDRGKSRKINTSLDFPQFFALNVGASVLDLKIEIKFAPRPELNLTRPDFCQDRGPIDPWLILSLLSCCLILGVC